MIINIWRIFVLFLIIINFYFGFYGDEINWINVIAGSVLAWSSIYHHLFEL